MEILTSKIFRDDFQLKNDKKLNASNYLIGEPMLKFHGWQRFFLLSFILTHGQKLAKQ